MVPDQEVTVRIYHVVLILCTVLSCVCFADQVTLSNGDHLTGQIIHSDGKTVTLKTDFMGQVEIQWSAVQQITSDHNLHVQSSNGKMVVGSLTTRDGEIEVVPKSGETVTIPKSEVSLIRNDAEQGTYEQSLHPKLTQNWEGGATVSFALTRGNSQTKNLGVAVNADRKTLHDKLSLYTNSVYNTNDATGAVPSTTANSVQGGARYDHDITPRLFGFVSADFQTDQLQTLDLRSVFGGGLGWHVIKRQATTLDLLGGANYTREAYTAFTRNFAAGTLGDEFMHKLHGSTVLTQSFYYYPDFNDFGDYRVTFNAGTVTKINKWLGWQNSFGDIYVTNPPVGKKKNDVVFTTGLNITFVHGGEAAK